MPFSPQKKKNDPSAPAVQSPKVYLKVDSQQLLVNYCAAHLCNSMGSKITCIKSKCNFIHAAATKLSRGQVDSFEGQITTRAQISNKSWGFFQVLTHVVFEPIKWSMIDYHLMGFEFGVGSRGLTWRVRRVVFDAHPDGFPRFIVGKFGALTPY